MPKNKQIDIDEYIKKLKRYEKLLFFIYAIFILLYILNLQHITDRVLWSFYEISQENNSALKAILKMMGGIILVLIPIIGSGLVFKYHKYVDNKIKKELNTAYIYKYSKKGKKS